MINFLDRKRWRHHRTRYRKSNSNEIKFKMNFSITIIMIIFSLSTINCFVVDDDGQEKSAINNDEINAQKLIILINEKIQSSNNKNNNNNLEINNVNHDLIKRNSNIIESKLIDINSEIDIDIDSSSLNSNNKQSNLKSDNNDSIEILNNVNNSLITSTIIDEESMKLPLYMRILATLACLIIFTIGVSGNFLVPLVVIKTKYLRNSTNLFLINLSMADLLLLIVSMPTVFIELHSRPETWLLGESMCKLSNFVEMLAANGSIFTILAISFERYYAICKPLKAGYKCTRLRATIIICIIWLLSITLTSPILIMAKSSETTYIDGSLVYNCILETDTYWTKMYVFISMFAFFCLPLLVLMLVYWLIGRRLIRENLAMSSGSSTTTTTTTATNSLATTSCEISTGTAGSFNNYYLNSSKSPKFLNGVLSIKRKMSLKKASSLKYFISPKQHNIDLNYNIENNSKEVNKKDEEDLKSTTTTNQIIDINKNNNNNNNNFINGKVVINTNGKFSNGFINGKKVFEFSRENKSFDNKQNNSIDYVDEKITIYNGNENELEINKDDETLKIENERRNSFLDKQDEKEEEKEENIIYKNLLSLKRILANKFLNRFLNYDNNNNNNDEQLSSSSSSSKKSFNDNRKNTKINNVKNFNDKKSFTKKFYKKSNCNNIEVSLEDKKNNLKKLNRLVSIDDNDYDDDDDDNYYYYYENDNPNDSNLKTIKDNGKQKAFLSSKLIVERGENVKGESVCSKLLIISDNSSLNSSSSSQPTTSQNNSPHLMKKAHLINRDKSTFKHQQQQQQKSKVENNEDKKFKNRFKRPKFNWSKQFSISSNISTNTSTSAPSTATTLASGDTILSQINNINRNIVTTPLPAIVQVNNSSHNNIMPKPILHYNNNNTSTILPLKQKTFDLNSMSNINLDDNVNSKQQLNGFIDNVAACSSISSSRNSPSSFKSNHSKKSAHFNVNNLVSSNCLSQPQQLNSNSINNNNKQNSPIQQKEEAGEEGAEFNNLNSSVSLSCNSTTPTLSSTSINKNNNNVELNGTRTPSPFSSKSCSPDSINDSEQKFKDSNNNNNNLRRVIYDDNNNNDSKIRRKFSLTEEEEENEDTFEEIKKVDIEDNNNKVKIDNETTTLLIYSNNNNNNNNNKNELLIIDNKQQGKNVIDKKLVGEEDEHLKRIFRRRTDRSKSTSFDQHHLKSTTTTNQHQHQQNFYHHFNLSRIHHSLLNHNYKANFTTINQHSKSYRSGSQPIVSSHHNYGNNNNNQQFTTELLVVQDLSKKQQMDSRRQVVVMLAFVVACFFLLFFPYRVFTIWLILSTEDQVKSLGMETYYNLTYFSRILIYLHSAINPIAYNLISTKFRRAFMSILFCRGSSTRRKFITEHHHQHHQNNNQNFHNQSHNSNNNNNYYYHHHRGLTSNNSINNSNGTRRSLISTTTTTTTPTSATKQEIIDQRKLLNT